LHSFSSFISAESLLDGAPFRLPLWDKASTEFYFARSRELLTKASPSIGSLDYISCNSLRTIKHSIVDSTETLVGEQYSCPSSPKLLRSKPAEIFRANTLPSSKKCDKLRRSCSDSESSIYVSNDVLNKVPINVHLIDDETAEL